MSLKFNSTKINTDINGSKTHMYSWAKLNWNWSLEIISRQSVGANFLVIPEIPNFIEVEGESRANEDSEPEMTKIDLTGFEAEIEYEIPDSVPSGMGMHLERVNIYIDRKKIEFVFHTNSF